MDNYKIVNNSIIMANYFEPFITCEVRYNEANNENELFVINANKYFSNITGVSNCEVLDKKFSDICPDTKNSIFDWSKVLINSAMTNDFKIIEQYFDGFNKFLKLFIFGYDNGIFHVIIKDITNKKQFNRILLEKNRQIEYLLEDMRSKNDKDSLTGLYNYQFALDSLDTSIQDYQREDIEFSLFLLEFAGIKKLNAECGYKKTDKILVQISEIIIANTRKIDVACRYCGNKFLIIFNNIDSDIAKIFIDRLKKTIKKAIILYDGVEIQFNGSMMDYSGQAAEEIVIELEDKLKKSKLLGKDVVL